MRTYLLLLLLPLAVTACNDDGLANDGTPPALSCPPCPSGLICVDSPSDSCDPARGDKNCLGVCAKPPDQKVACKSITDAASCAARSDCASAGCPLCAGKESFLSCFDANGAPPSLDCPAVACAAACNSHIDEASCLADTSCYPLLTNSDVACACDQPGCCAVFDHCAEGPAYCQSVGPATPCPFSQPCGPGKSPVYDNGMGCPIGCTDITECPGPDGV